jgi:hypothetical protein
MHGCIKPGIANSQMHNLVFAYCNHCFWICNTSIANAKTSVSQAPCAHLVFWKKCRCWHTGHLCVLCELSWLVSVVAHNLTNACVPTYCAHTWSVWSCTCTWSANSNLLNICLFWICNTNFKNWRQHMCFGCKVVILYVVVCSWCCKFKRHKYLLFLKLQYHW